ncbi:hypothetical protein LC609_30145 [Nostoc sp. XA013]|nr:hypothetical protein [Nostoc sp. XA013]
MINKSRFGELHQNLINSEAIGQNNPELVDYIPDFLKKSGIYLSGILTLLPRFSNSLSLDFLCHVESQAIANAENSPNHLPSLLNFNLAFLEFL